MGILPQFEGWVSSPCYADDIHCYLSFSTAEKAVVVLPDTMKDSRNPLGQWEIAWIWDYSLLQTGGLTNRLPPSRATAFSAPRLNLLIFVFHCHVADEGMGQLGREGLKLLFPMCCNCVNGEGAGGTLGKRNPIRANGILTSQG